MAKVKHLEQTEVKSRKKWIITGVAILIVTAIASAAFYLKTTTKTLDPNDPTQYTKSKDFKELEFKEQREYMQKLRGNMKNMSQEDRRKIHDNMRNMMHAKMKQRLNEFFQMSRAEKDARLDEDIARMLARANARKNNQNQKQAQNNNQKPKDAQNGKRTPPSADAMRERESNMEPTTKAQREVYRKELQARAAATGVTLPSGGSGPRR